MAKVSYGPVKKGAKGHYRVAVYEDGRYDLGVRKFATAEEARDHLNDRPWGSGQMAVVFVREAFNGRRAHLRRLAPSRTSEEAVMEKFEAEYGKDRGDRIYYATKQKRGVEALTTGAPRSISREQDARLKRFLAEHQGGA